MREEGHHHLVFSNRYVNVFFVEIPPHETTLLHHHDLPYISIPPGGRDALPEPSISPSPESTQVGPRVSYADGDFSHAVSNSGDRVLRNVAIELIREQGTVRNYCAAVGNELRRACYPPDLTAANPVRHYRLFETDELLVESWEFGPGASYSLRNDRLDVLVGGLTDVTVTGPPGIDSAHEIRGGLLWVPAGANAFFKSQSDRGGHFIAITFKDSAQASR